MSTGGKTKWIPSENKIYTIVMKKSIKEITMMWLIAEIEFKKEGTNQLENMAEGEDVVLVVEGNDQVKPKEKRVIVWEDRVKVVEDRLKVEQGLLYNFRRDVKWNSEKSFTSRYTTVNQKQFYPSEHTEQSLKSENAHHPMTSNLSNAYLNGSSTLNTNVPSSINISTHARRVDTSPNMLSSQATNMPMMQVMNGGIKSETAFTLT